MKTYLLLPHLRIHGANGMSCAYAAGFPAVTGFLGFVQALENLTGMTQFKSVGLVVHKSEFQAYYQETSYCWNLKLRKFAGDHYGNPSPITEEALIHLEMSFLIECDELSPEQEAELRKRITELLPTMRVAGGSIFGFWEIPSLYHADNEDASLPKNILHRLMPGYALISRTDLLDNLQKEGKGDALDRILYAISTKATPSAHSETETVEWKRERTEAGWLIPLAVGFHDLSGALRVKQQRSYQREHHFAEPLITLCEFKMPYHFQRIDDMMWHYEYDSSHKNYLCVN